MESTTDAEVVDTWIEVFLVLADFSVASTTTWARRSSALLSTSASLDTSTRECGGSKLEFRRQEKISGLKPMLKWHLNLWKTEGKNTQSPENLLIYRDGMSEGAPCAVASDGLGVWYDNQQDGCKVRLGHRHDMDGGWYVTKELGATQELCTTSTRYMEGYSYSRFRTGAKMVWDKGCDDRRQQTFPRRLSRSHPDRSTMDMFSHVRSERDRPIQRPFGVPGACMCRHQAGPHVEQATMMRQQRAPK
ncbi:hypothetical protein Daus18300_011265 [Diaporthe australafricana]|uniref:Uncharacterized protein n=1 Tax=Diaporthe australafricana TaxID=127596 RepID=A0ABR3W7G8_9PEZI